MRARRRRWQPRPATCTSCGKSIEVVRKGDAVTAGAGFLPNIPGAVCDACLEHADGMVVADLRDEMAGHMLHSIDFELKTVDAAQVFLDLHGWQPLVIAGAAMRLHADNKHADAIDLLDAAMEAGDAPGYYKVEKAQLKLLDGETGQAHDLLSETSVDDHPCWHLQRGILAHSVGRPEAALEHWRLQIEVHPEEMMAWKMIGFHLMQEADDPVAAEAHYRAGCDQFPRFMEFRAWLGDALMRQDRLPEALTELKASLDLEPLDDEFTAGVRRLVADIEADLGKEQ